MRRLLIGFLAFAGLAPSASGQDAWCATMGLAAAEEVASWFYVANTAPRLGPEYYPPDRIAVQGDRRNVTIDQVIAALGPRRPSSAESPRRFRVLFVLVTDDDADANADAVARMTHSRRVFERDFRLATGGRAEVITEFGSSIRRRSVAH